MMKKIIYFSRDKTKIWQKLRLYS